MASGSFSITIDSTKIDSTLTNFPVMIYLSSSSGTGAFNATAIFDDLGANSKKIKVKNSSGTELYCEIEAWDSVAEKATLHVKVDSVSSSADTELSLEWDSTWADNTTYIGDTGDTAAESVWDSNFVAVYHMNQDPSGAAPQILDSTSNDNDMTSHGSMASNDLVDADFGKAIAFNGAQWVEKVISDIDPLTVECKASRDISSGGEGYKSVLVGVDYDGSNIPWQLRWFQDGTNTLQLSTFLSGASGGSDQPLNGTNSTAVGNWVCFFATKNSTSFALFETISSKLTDTLIDTSNTQETAIGGYPSTSAGFEGKIAEVRLSNAVRSDAWIKATNETLNDSIASLASGPVPPAPTNLPIYLGSSAISAIYKGSVNITDIGLGSV